MIKLLEHEKLFFEKIDEILQGFQENDDIHVSGGWVRDKLLGKESLDIDLVLKKQLVNNFCNHLETMLKDNILIMSPEQFLQYQQNPNQFKKKQKLNFLNRSPPHIITQKPLDGIFFHCIIIEYVNENESFIFKVDIREYFQNELLSDAKARDFTVNAMYYSIKNRQVVDLVGVFQKGLK